MAADTVQNPLKDDTKPIATPIVGATSSTQKETEPMLNDNSEEQILSEIVKTSEAADEQASDRVKESLNELKKEHFLAIEPEAKLAQPAPVLPADVADSGVKAPQLDANEVIMGGTTLNVEMSEKEYDSGLKESVAGKKSLEKVVFGVPSVIAFALWVGKMLKKAHGHAIRVVFKRGGQ